MDKVLNSSILQGDHAFCRNKVVCHEVSELIPQGIGPSSIVCMQIPEVT